MKEQAASTISIKQLMQTRDALIMYHALCAAAKLWLADLL